MKKTKLDAYANQRKSGIIAITLEQGDALIEALITDGDRELLLITRLGKAIRFPEGQAREVGRGARGVRGIRLDKGDEVIAMALVRPKAELLTVTSLGFGKRTNLEEYRVQSRGGKGIINIKVTKKNGEVVGAKTVTDQDEVMLISQDGMMVRSSAKGVRTTGRAAQGVRLINIKDKDRVASVAAVVPKEKEETVNGTAASSPAATPAPSDAPPPPKAPAPLSSTPSKSAPTTPSPSAPSAKTRQPVPAAGHPSRPALRGHLDGGRSEGKAETGKTARRPARPTKAKKKKR